MEHFARLDLVMTPQPHFIPGYTGYCPGLQFSCGTTYGRGSHLLLMNPSIRRSQRLALAHLKPTREESQNIKDILVAQRNCETDVVFHQPISVSYKGLIPRARQLCGMTYGKMWPAALADFEEQQRIVRKHHRDLEKETYEREGNKPIACEDFTPAMLCAIKENLN